MEGKVTVGLGVSWTGVLHLVCVRAKALQSCPTLCDPLDCMGFSRQEYWSGWPRPPPGQSPDPGIDPMSLMFPALAGRFLMTSATWEALCTWHCHSTAGSLRVRSEPPISLGRK